MLHIDFPHSLPFHSFFLLPPHLNIVSFYSSIQFSYYPPLLHPGPPFVHSLLDPPLREFLPAVSPRDEIAALATEMSLSMDQIMLRIQSLQESNSFLGFRGVRVCVVLPEICEMQVCAVVNAAVQVK